MTTVAEKFSELDAFLLVLLENMDCLISWILKIKTSDFGIYKNQPTIYQKQSHSI